MSVLGVDNFFLHRSGVGREKMEFSKKKNLCERNLKYSKKNQNFPRNHIFVKEIWIILNKTEMLNKLKISQETWNFLMKF